MGLNRYKRELSGASGLCGVADHVLALSSPSFFKPGANLRDLALNNAPGSISIGMTMVILVGANRYLCRIAVRRRDRCGRGS